MELCKDGGNMITWFGVRDEKSSGILYSLQWLKGRLRKSREHRLHSIAFWAYFEPRRRYFENDFGSCCLHQTFTI